MGKTALITGATSGIGKETAEIFADNGINVIICGRRKERLTQLEKRLKRKVKVHSLCFDLRDKSTVFKAIKSLPKNFSEIDILVNNAGNAHGLSTIDEADTDDW